MEVIADHDFILADQPYPAGLVQQRLQRIRYRGQFPEKVPFQRGGQYAVMTGIGDHHRAV